MVTSVDVKRPKYLQLAEQLRRQIVDGDLPPHSPLPSLSEMKARFHATQWTVEKVHALLEEEGLIRREPRRGIFVNDTTARPITDFVALFDEKFARKYPYSMEIHRGVRQQAEACGKSIALIDNPFEFKHWKTMDGLLWETAQYSYPPPFADKFPKDMPIVRLHYPEANFSCVMADDAAGVRMAVEHLLALGHSRIGYLLYLRSPGKEHYTYPVIKTRLEAYRKSLQDHDIVPEPSWTTFYEITEFMDGRDWGYETMQRWLQKGWRDLKLTAMLAQNDYIATGLIRALEEHGIHVPEDISVVGYDGVDFLGPNSIELTTIEAPLFDIGLTAMKLLSTHINQPSRKSETIRLPVRFREGASTMPPKRG